MIRRATEYDVTTMAILWRELVLEENPKANPDCDQWAKSQRTLMSLPNYYAFVAEENDHIVGFNNGLLIIDPETREKYIEGGQFYVLPEYRKGSAGMRLHRNSFKLGKELGAKWLRRKVSINNKRMVERCIRKYRVKEYVVDEPLGGMT
jgi:GNAT superfamily N-acetyltransferase